MQPELLVDTGSFSLAVERYRRATLRDIELVLMRGYSGFMRRLMGITPPAEGTRGEGGRLTTEDKKRGETAILADLNVLFRAEDGVALALARRLNGGRDIAPVAIHRDAFARFKVPGKRMRSPLGRGRKYVIDTASFRALAADLMKRVGRTAAGWLPGAILVKASGIPNWVRRHGLGLGTATLVRSSYATTFSVANNSVPVHLAPEMTRRMGYAAQYTAAALERETVAILAKRGLGPDRV